MIETLPITKNIVHLADSANNEDDIVINKHSSKLKTWSVEMPNAPYSKRWHTLKTTHEK